jgi:hypothetical protein
VAPSPLFAKEGIILLLPLVKGGWEGFQDVIFYTPRDDFKKEE